MTKSNTNAAAHTKANRNWVVRRTMHYYGPQKAHDYVDHVAADGEVFLAPLKAAGVRMTRREAKNTARELMDNRVPSSEYVLSDNISQPPTYEAIRA